MRNSSTPSRRKSYWDGSWMWGLMKEHKFCCSGGLGIFENRNNVTHPTDKLSVEGSARFLAKYWTELCSTQHQRSSFDSKGKELVVDSLVAKKKNVTKAPDAAWEAPTTGWLKLM